MTFFENCTTTNFETSSNPELIAYTAFDATDSAEALADIIRKTHQTFGPSSNAPVAYDYLSEIPHTIRQFIWKFTPERLEEVI